MGRKHMPRDGEPALCITRFTRQSLGLMRALLNGIEESGPLSIVLEFPWPRDSEEA